MKYSIIGLGIAGVKAASTIRSLDKEADIDIFTNETCYYYPRPKLFGLIYQRIKSRDIYFYDPAWYIRHNFNLHLGTGIRKVNAKEHTLLTEDGGTEKYDKLLIANGAHCFIPPIPGYEKRGVLTIRDMKDALNIRQYSSIIGNYSPVAVIGGGVLGLEMAHSFMSNKLKVTVIEYAPYLLQRQLDKEGADILRGIFENWGIKVRTDAKTERIEGGKSVENVLLTNGEKIPAKMVILSTGVRPNVDLLDRSNLPYNKGALVDDYLKLIDTEDIYAAGDITEHNGRVYGIIPPAIEQAVVAAKNMVEERSVIYKGSTSINTLKIAGLDLTSVGEANPKNEEQYTIIRAKAPLEGKYRKIVLKNGKSIGAIVLGIKGESVAAAKIVNQKMDILKFQEQLQDINFSLKEVLKG